MQQPQQFVVQCTQSINPARKANAQCYNCSGYGHYYWECHLHHKQESEVEDETAVNGITEDDVEDEEKDMVGDNKVPKEYQYKLL